MNKVTFLANQNSVHVKRWLEVVDQNLFDLGFLDLVLPSFMKVFKYILLGLVARFKKDLGLLHAHSALGYGLSAWISGKKYVVTVYGTEVFSAKPGSFKRWLLRKIFSDASAVTCTSDEMRQLLISDFCVPGVKVHNFSLGISDLFRGSLRKKKTSIAFFHNRRLHPHYNVNIIIEAFEKLVADNENVQLKLLSGDCEFDYKEKIKSDICDAPWVKLYDSRLSQQEVAEILNSSDFSISIPKSDQLSASILESMASGCIPVVAPLKAYNALRGSGVVFLREVSVLELYKTIKSLILLAEQEVMEKRNRVEEYIIENESSLCVKGNVTSVYHYVLG